MKLLNKYPLSLTAAYVSDWSLWEAVREIIQNALDNDSGHSISYDSSEETLTITSDSIKLDASTLLLGNTSKRNDNTKIGSFGEGYKIACLVLLKEGYDVIINNSDVIWKPEFQHSELFNTEVLTVEEYEGSLLNTSFEFVISGVGSSDYEEIRQKTLHLDYYATSDEGSDYKETKWGNIILGGGGAVYVNGLFVCNESMAHSYDIKPQYLKLDRDRNSVSNWDFTILRANMWADAGLTEEAVDQVLQGSYEFSCIHSKLDNNDVQSIIDKTVDRYGESYFVGSQESADYLEKKGIDDCKVINLEVAELINNSGLYEYVPEEVEELSPNDIVSIFSEELEGELEGNVNDRAVLERVNNLVRDLIEKSEEWGV